MANAFKVRMMGGAFALIAVFSVATWAETPVPAELAQEEAYLDVLPKVEIPEDIQPIPGAVNEEFRNCEASWPAGYALARSGPEARALRDIYSFVRAQNVISTGDCGCSGKVANWEGVEEIAAAFRERHDVERLSWQQTELVSAEAKKLIAIAETMCGGSFWMDSVSAILTTLDAAITSAGRQYFEATAGAVGPIYTTLLALLLVMVGINAALNVYRISMRDAVQLSFRIVMVLMFGLTWSNFTQIYDAASNGLSALALEYFRLGGGGVGASATAAMDDMANMMAGNVDSVSSAMSSIMRGFVAAVLYVVLGVLMAVYVFIVGFSKLMIAFLLGVAPIAIGATIFEKTKGMFEAWLSAMIGYLMYPVASAGVIVAVVTVAHDVFRKTEDVTDLGSILGFFVIVFVGIFALMAIPNAVTHITGQISLASIAPQALRVAGKPLEKASDYSARRMNEVRSGFMHGKTQHHHLRDQARSDAERGQAARARLGQFIRDS